MDEWTLNDLLECSVCLERLDTSSKVLPCQHTFCKKCLEEIVSTHKELRCPECRVLVEVKIEELPPNVLLMRILEGMRNAAPKKRNVAPNRMQGGHFPQATPIQQQVTPAVAQNPVPSHASNVPQLDISTRAHQAPKPIAQANQPYAKAVYDYLSIEPGDLCFKKGDIILLRKKIDTNWYHGECEGSQGVFPLAYVQVITPLPSHIPQCKALYDFRMTNDDEEGCLTFNKGEVITVIRRVDENWAEGKLADRIGIFPLAFVELNGVARALMKLSTNSQPGPSRVAPPTPTSEDTTPLIPTDHSRTVAPSHPPSDSSSATTVSSASSSTTTPNTSSSNTSSSSSTAPSSPTSPPPPCPQQQQQQHKRHSFGVLHSGHHHHTSHRHSAEILSPTENSAQDGVTADQSQVGGSGDSVQRQGSQRHRRSGSSDLAVGPPPPPQGSHHGPSTTANLPAAYIALYPYKPQKVDELELKKGAFYMVTERCQDGWFKGTSSRTQKCGVFPGNYVTPAKVLPSVQAQLRGLTRSGTNTGAPQQPTSPRNNNNNNGTIAVSYTRCGTKLNTVPLNFSPRLHTLNLGTGCPQVPPELPPRSCSPSVISSPWHGQQPPLSQDPPSVPLQLGRSHSAVMTGGCEGTPSRTATSHVSTTVTPPPNVSVSATTPRLDKTKEKKEKGVSLMRRLTSMKKSKSPPPQNTYSMDNPVFEDGTLASSPAHPVHVRSGSCPSQLLQVVPLDGSTTSHHRLFGTGSQRSKHKERPNVVMANLSHIARAPETVAVACGTSTVNHHRKSNSLDAGSDAGGRKPNKQLVPPVRERFRCIVAYPPNSEYELELRVGDIIYVHKKRDDGWYKGTQQRTGRTGLFPASFVESF